MDAFPVNELAVFRIAFSIESDELREEYLQQVCREDRKLYNRVAELLRASQKAPGFLESPPAGVGPTIDGLLVAERPGQTIDRYKLLQEIGEGGFGVVYMAEQQQPVCRKVALKIIKPGMDTKQVIARFEAEEQALAMMDHPNIAKVHDAGMTESGRPYFVMELVHGVPLTDYCDQNQLTTNQRLELFVSVCQAIQHAHQKGIIHRDIKPSNVMVTLHDGVPVPKIIDFGIAKATDRRLTERTLFTSYGQIVGTPLYMSPEQAEMSGLDIDTRSDIYSLGAVLYELLTGSTPFDQERIRGAGYDEMRRMIREEEPPRPSDRLSTLAAGAASTISTHRRADPTQLSHLLRGELDWIVMKALEKDRARRYETANDLAKDVQRHLNDEPVEACPPSTAYRLRKFAHRHKAKLAIIATCAALLLIAAVGRLWVNQKDAALAQVRADVARQISDELSTARALRGDVESGSLPDSHDLTRALEAARRAESLLSTGDVDEGISTQVTRLLTSLESQSRDQSLQAALEETWEWEMDQLAEQHEFEWHPGFQLLTRALAGAATRYEEALASWGLKPNTTSVADAARRIQALHPSYQASILVSLDRWRKLIGAPRSLQDWEQVEWSVLESVKLTSRGGDLLQAQPDGSILASGGHPERGYELVLETEQQDIAALRLEAMLDDSLPSRGPGRGRAGCFTIDGLYVSYAPRANPNSKRRLEFRSAVADYADPNSSLTAESWHIGGGGGKAHIAVFEVAEPVHSESGFRLTISHQDRDGGWWGNENQNLGRFRWSVSADHDDGRVTRWLTKVINQADRDDWRRSMRSEIQRGDIAALVERASDTQAVQDQPEIILIQLAKALQESDDTNLLGMLPDTINWEVLKPIGRESERGATLELLDDGSIFSSGTNPYWDTLVITAPVENRPITAIRFEAIPDHRLPSGGAGRGLGGCFTLMEFGAEVHPASDQDAKQRLAIDRAIADYAPSPGASIAKAVDGLRSTGWHIPPGHRQPHTAVFVTTPPKAEGDGEVRLQICLEAGQRWEGLGRFRLSVTHDPIHLPDPKRAALTLLRRIHQQHPGNYWVNVALAETLSQQTPPAFDEAVRYATAALALRPNKAMPHATLLRVLPTSQGDLEQAFFHASRLRELDPDDASVEDTANRQTALGVSLFGQGKLDEAIAKWDLAIRLHSGHARAHCLRGIALEAQGKLDDAIDAFRQTLACNPKHYVAQANISHLLVRQGRLDKAIVAAQKALEIDPECAEGHRALSAALAAKGRLSEATDAYQECLNSVRRQGRMGQAVDIVNRQVATRPRDPFAHFEYGIVMLEQGEIGEAIRGFGTALELDPEQGMALLYLGNALRQQGSLDEAIKAYCKAVSVHPRYTYAHRDLGITLMAQGNFRDARDVLQTSMDISGGGDGRDWFFVAMSEWQMGNKEAARRWYDQAVRWIDDNGPENEQLVEARAEAEKTLGLKQSDAEQED